MGGFRFPPRGWLATALFAGNAAPCGVPGGAYLAAIRDFESDHRIGEGPRRGPWMVPVVGLEPTLL